MINFTINDAEVMSDLLSLEDRARDMTEVMREIGDYLVDSVHENFDAEGRPTRWASRQDDNPWPILYKTGNLYNSIEYNAQADSVTVGTEVPYGPVHDEGLGNMPQRQFLLIQDSDYPALDEMLFEYFS